MSQLNHPYFGALDTDTLEDTDVIWEKDLDLQGLQTEAALWADAEQPLNAADLDAFAQLLQDLPALDARARTALVAMLREDRDFIDYHTDALEEGAEGLERTAALQTTAKADGKDEVSAEAFAAALQLTHVGLWLSDVGDSPVVMDYQLDPEASDQILAVKCTAQGQVQDIDWES